VEFRKLYAYGCLNPDQDSSTWFHEPALLYQMSLMIFKLFSLCFIQFLSCSSFHSQIHRNTASLKLINSSALHCKPNKSPVFTRRYIWDKYEYGQRLILNPGHGHLHRIQKTCRFKCLGLTRVYVHAMPRYPLT